MAAEGSIELHANCRSGLQDRASAGYARPVGRLAHEGAPMATPVPGRLLLRPCIDLSAVHRSRRGQDTLMAAVAVMALLGPLRQRRGETVLVASSFSQAKISFDHILAFMRPLLKAGKAKWRVAASSQHASIEHRASGARVRCIGRTRAEPTVLPLFCVAGDKSSTHTMVIPRCQRIPLITLWQP